MYIACSVQLKHSYQQYACTYMFLIHINDVLSLQTTLEQTRLDNITRQLSQVLQRANQTEDQSKENLDAIRSIFEEIAEPDNVVLDTRVSLSYNYRDFNTQL